MLSTISKLFASDSTYSSYCMPDNTIKGLMFVAVHVTDCLRADGYLGQSMLYRI